MVALVAVFCTCSIKFRHESSHIPRYFTNLDSEILLVSPRVLVGTVINGPWPVLMPWVDLEKWMSSLFAWSTLRPRVLSHEWAVLKAASTSLVAVSQLGADAKMELSSTYSVSGLMFALPEVNRLLSSSASAISMSVSLPMSVPIGAVK